MKITVLKNPVTTPPGKNYQVVELGYRTDEGKVKGMRLFGFGDSKAHYDVAKDAAVGDVLEATFKQNDKGYWVFNTLIATGEKGDATAPAATDSKRSGGNWETAEERKARQVYIARQSSLQRAVEYFELTKGKPNTTDVIELAEFFTTYVQNGLPSAKVE